METKLEGTSTNVHHDKMGGWARAAAQNSWLRLWLGEIGCILFVLLGIFILTVDPQEWVLATLATVAFGCGAICIAVQLILKWRHRNSGEMMSVGESSRTTITNKRPPNSFV